MRGQLAVIIGGLCFLAGAALGWASHARQFNKAQVQWVEAVKDAHVRTDIALRDSKAQRARADSLRGLARQGAQAAGALDAVRDVAIQNKRVAEQALRDARTTGDSLHAAMQVIGALNHELAIQTDQAGRWRLAFQQEQAAAALLGARGDSLEVIVQRQDSLLVRGTQVVGSSGCRIPLIGVKCPEVLVGYGYTAGTDGNTVALHRGVAVTVGWRVL